MEDLKKQLQEHFDSIPAEEWEIAEIETKRAIAEAKAQNFETKLKKLESTGLSKRHIRASIKDFQEFFRGGEKEFNFLNSSFLIFGTFGSGKTHLAHAIARIFLESGKSVKMIDCSNVTNIIVPLLKKNGSASDFYKKEDLLIFDDLGLKELSKLELNFVYEIIWHRYNQCLPTIITTTKNLCEIFYNDEAILSRFEETYQILQLPNKNHRIKS